MDLNLGVTKQNEAELLLYENKFRNDAIKILKFIFNSDNIRKATEYEDKKLATDIVVNEKIRIAFRVRENKYINKKNEFTIRTKSKSEKIRTELDKIKDGLVDYMLYCFLDNRARRIIYFSLIDLKAFGNHLSNVDYPERKNFDNTAFIAPNKNNFDIFDEDVKEKILRRIYNLETLGNEKQ